MLFSRWPCGTAGINWSKYSYFKGSCGILSRVVPTWIMYHLKFQPGQCNTDLRFSICSNLRSITKQIDHWNLIDRWNLVYKFPGIFQSLDVKKIKLVCRLSRLSPISIFQVGSKICKCLGFWVCTIDVIMQDVSERVLIRMIRTMLQTIWNKFLKIISCNVRLGPSYLKHF